MSRYIDAEKLIDYKFAYITNECYKDGKRKSEEEIYAYKVGYNEAIDNIIKFADPIDVPQNVHAHWVYKALEGFPEITFPVCSNCGEDAIDYVESNFCPCCGAVMDERSEEE